MNVALDIEQLSGRFQRWFRIWRGDRWSGAHARGWYEGRILAANLLDGRYTTADYRAIPSVVFTLPPLAGVGLSEADARSKYPEIVVKHEDTSKWYSSRRVGESFSAFKVLIDTRTDQIVGAHLLGPSADETINLFTLAMRGGINATQFKQTLWSYPTHASDTSYMV